jgi:hypothetical protein
MRFKTSIFIGILLIFGAQFVFATENQSQSDLDMFPSNFDKEYALTDIAKVLDETYRGDEGITTQREDIDLRMHIRYM